MAPPYIDARSHNRLCLCVYANYGYYYTYSFFRQRSITVSADESATTGGGPGLPTTGAHMSTTRTPPTLFTPLVVGGLTLPNRLVMGSMHTA